MHVPSSHKRCPHLCRSPVVLGSLLLPAGPLLWTPFLNSPLFRLWRDYFNYSLVCDWDHFDLSKRYILAGRIQPLSVCLKSLQYPVFHGSTPAGVQVW